MTSSFPQVILGRPFYVKSRNSIRSGQTEAPYAPLRHPSPTRPT